jgi:prolyl oligopeptidase
MEYSVSDDGKLLAYGVSASGSDWREWRIREVDTGRDLEDHLIWTKFTPAAWTPDCRGFFYSRFDPPEEGMTYKEANYNQKLYYHRIGATQAEDVLVYERPDHKEWRFRGDVTDDGRFLVITVTRGTLRENGVFYIDLEDGDWEVRELLKEFDSKYDFVGNDGTVFFFTTDLEAPMSRVIAVDLSDPLPSSWREVIPESRDSLRGVSFINDRFIAVYLHDVKSQILVYDMGGIQVGEVELPVIGSVTGFTGKRMDSETFYHLTGFTTPGTVYRYDAETGESSVFREPEIGFDPGEYVSEQVFYESKDRTRIPMFVCHRKGLKKDGNNPTYLYGYGGFNNALTPRFNVRNLVWIEMGGVFAQANMRGGGEYGKSWHEAGTKLKKQNVFDDFIAAAEWLIDRGYTSTPRLSISGRSNGGLLAGACLVQRPDLYGVVLPIVGVLDMLRFEKFTVGWGWVSDYGSVDNPDEFKALLAYSPYHNIKPGTKYPPTLVTTGDHDDRVFPAHSFKFASALQEAQDGPSPVLIRIDSKAGHGMGKPSSKLIEEYSDELAFIAENLGVR